MSDIERPVVEPHQIELDASLAISGAEYVREKLAALTAMGPRPLYDEVYAIKLRTKTTESLTKKVQYKRTKGNRPEYSALSATDIVGMRLLSLFASDLPKVTRSLFTFLRFCQSPQIGLIKGENLNDAIREIVIYKSKQAESAAVYEKIYRFCKFQPVDEFHEDGTKKIDIIDFQTTDKSYSSVHIVIDAISYSGGNPKSIPVEIQIRTVFEDTWGEIDHKLEYKFREIITESVPADILVFYKNFQSSLRKLKSKLEDVGSDAELIRDGYENILARLPAVSDSRKVEPFVLRPVYVSESFENRIRLSKKNSRQLAFEKEFNDLVEQAVAIRNIVKNPIETSADAENAISLITEYADELDAHYKKFIGEKLFGKATSRKVIYFYRMETALCYMWMYLISDHFYPEMIENNIGFIDESINIYFELDKIDYYRDDLFLNYRLGCALVAKGKSEDGESFFYRALELIPVDRYLSTASIAAVIPHYMSFVVWRHRASMLEMGFKTANVRINRQNQLEIVGESLFWTLYAKWFLNNAKYDDDDISKQIEIDIANNIVSYIWEIRDLSADTQEFKLVVLETLKSVEEYIESSHEINDPIVKIDFRNCGEIISEANTSDRSGHEIIQFADTLMKYYQMMGLEKERNNMYNWLEKNIHGNEGGTIRRIIPIEVLMYSLSQVKHEGDRYALAKDMMDI